MLNSNCNWLFKSNSIGFAFPAVGVTSLLPSRTNRTGTSPMILGTHPLYQVLRVPNSHNASWTLTCKNILTLIFTARQPGAKFMYGCINALSATRVPCFLVYVLWGKCCSTSTCRYLTQNFRHCLSKFYPFTHKDYNTPWTPPLIT